MGVCVSVCARMPVRVGGWACFKKIQIKKEEIVGLECEAIRV